MHIQRYGADAEIISPAELREPMRGMLAAALGEVWVGGPRLERPWPRFHDPVG